MSSPTIGLYTVYCETIAITTKDPPRGIRSRDSLDGTRFLPNSYWGGSPYPSPSIPFFRSPSAGFSPNQMRSTPWTSAGERTDPRAFPLCDAATVPSGEREMSTVSPAMKSSVNQDGARVRLKSLIESGKPVVLDFIYGTCTTICPVLSAGYTSLQGKLGPDTRRMQLISISIDPEHDTPKIMKGYLKQYRAKPGWDFLTGSREDIDRVMRAFDSYVSDKMFHKQVTFIRAQGPGEWVRIDGLLGSTDLMNEIGKASKK